MDLVRETGEFTSWLWRATRRLIEVDRGAALRLIVAMSVNQIVTVLVFFLPLKIVLLIASDGVPKYFKFFITQETRTAWLAALATGVFVLYMVSLRLDAMAVRSAGRGAESLVAIEQQVPIISNPTDFSRKTFYRIGEIAGSLVFSFLALVGGALVFPSFFLAIPILILIEFVLVAFAASRGGGLALSNLGRYVKEQPLSLLKYLQEISFLLAFGLLLILFIAFSGLNPLLGIAAIMLSRRVLAAMKSVAQDAIKLSRSRHLVDALLFTNVRVRATPPKAQQLLLESAAPSVRTERLQNLVEVTGSRDSVETFTQDGTVVDLLQRVQELVWVDSGQNGVAILDLYGEASAGGRERLFREYLYSAKASRGLQQQDYLRTFLSVDALRCPTTILGYRREGVVGRIVDFRGFTESDRKKWRVQRQELLGHLWSVEVPTELVEAYHGAHERFHERLGGQFLSSLRVTADEAWGKATYDLFAAKLPEVRERVGQLPVTLVNERLRRANVMRGPGGYSCLLDWTVWKIHPVGAGFAPDKDGRDLLERAASSAVALTGRNRMDVINDVLLAGLLDRMDRLISESYPKAALSVAHAMLPVLEAPELCAVDEVLPPKEGAGSDLTGEM